MWKSLTVRLAIFWLLISSVVALLPVLAQDEEGGEGPNERQSALKAEIEDIVMDIPGMDQVLFVTEGTLDDDRLYLEIAYNTRETNLYGYYLEAMDVFRAVGQKLEAEEALIVERVAVTPTVMENSPIETMAVDVDILFDFITGEITRTAFFEAVETIPGAHQIPGDDAGSA